MITNREKSYASHWSMTLMVEFMVHKKLMTTPEGEGRNESRRRDNIMDSNKQKKKKLFYLCMKLSTRICTYFLQISVVLITTF